MESCPCILIPAEFCLVHRFRISGYQKEKPMSVHEIRIVLADADLQSREELKSILRQNGYQVAAEAGDGFDAVQSCKELHPDLLILDIALPLLDGLSAAKVVQTEGLADAVMILTACSDWTLIEQAKTFGVSSYLMKPVDAKALIPNMEFAVLHSREIRRLRENIAQVSDQLESRTLIDKARGQIMSQLHISDREASDYLQGISEAKNLPLRRVAEILLIKTEG